MKDETKFGVILSYLMMFISYIATFFLTPFTIRFLGQAEYGIYSLMGSFATNLTLFDLGIGATIIRYVAKYRRENKQKELENFLSMTFVIYCIISVIIMIVGTILCGQLPNIFANSLTDAEIKKCQIMFLMLIINIIFTMICTVFNSALTGFERFIVPRVISLLFLVLRIISNIMILFVGPTAIMLTFTTVVFGILGSIISAFYALRKLHIKIYFKNINYKGFGEIFKFSLFVFIQMLVSQIYWQIDSLILGIMTTSVLVAIYGVGMQLNNIVLNVTTSITSVILPKATQLAVDQADSNVTTDFMIKISRFILILYSYISIAFVFFGKQFINIWAGDGYELAYYVTCIVILSSAVARIQSPANDIMKAKFLHGFPVVVNLISAVLNVILTIVLVRLYGLIGAAIGTAAAMIIGNTIIYNIYLNKKVGIDVKRFFKGTFKGITYTIVLTIAAATLLVWIPGDGFLSFLIKCILYSVAFFISLYKLGLNQEEHLLLKQMIKKILRRGRNVTS